MAHSAPAGSWGKQQHQPTGASQSSSTTAIGLASQHHWEHRQPEGVPDNPSWPGSPITAGRSWPQWPPQAPAQQRSNNTSNGPHAGAPQRAPQHADAFSHLAAQLAPSNAPHAVHSAGNPVWPGEHVPGHVSQTMSRLSAPTAWPMSARAQPVSVLTLIGQPGQLGHPGQRTASAPQQRTTIGAPPASAEAAPPEVKHASTGYSAGCKASLVRSEAQGAGAQHASAPAATGRGGGGSGAGGALLHPQHPAQPGRAQTAPAQKQDAEQRFLPARSPALRTRLDQWGLPSSIVQVCCTPCGSCNAGSANIVYHALPCIFLNSITVYPGSEHDKPIPDCREAP